VPRISKANRGRWTAPSPPGVNFGLPLLCKQYKWNWREFLLVTEGDRFPLFIVKNKRKKLFVAQGSWEERLVSYCEHQIRTDKSSIYGDGFRAAFESFQRMGLPSLVRHAQQTGGFPALG